MLTVFRFIKPLDDTRSYSAKVAFLIALLSIIISAAIWSISKSHHESLALHMFEASVNENINSIQKRMAKYENILRSGIGFFQGSQEVSRSEWHDFLNTIDIKKNYPGMQGVGFSKMLCHDEVAKTEQQMREEGMASFLVHPEGKRDIYSSILYLEPMDKRNLAAIGYDMFSEPVRREAMETARDTGMPAISGKVTLLQEIDEDVQPGILMYLPLYKKGADLDSLEARRAALEGFVYSPFRMRDLMDKIVIKSSVVDFELYDSDNISDSTLLYKTFHDDLYVPKYRIKKVLKVNNREWYIHFHSTEEFDDSTKSFYPLLMTAAGIMVQLIMVYVIFILLKNRTALKIQAAELSKLHQAIEQSPSTIVITDLEGNIEYANEAFSKTTGYTREEAIGQNPRFLQSGRTLPKVYDEMWECLTTGKVWHGEFINKTKSGDEYIEDVRTSPIFKADGSISNYVAIKEDITEQKKTQERIHYLANFDALTGLANRFLLNEQIQYALKGAKRNEENFSVIFLDLDHFKEINDTLGHDAGDILLVEMSKRFTSILREVDTVARLGGDEFIFILPNTDESGAASAAQKLLQTIERPIMFGEQELLVTGSLGIAVYPQHGTDKETLFKKADDAMYIAKHEGKNRYFIYQDPKSL